jgi:hypothetical protein
MVAEGDFDPVPMGVDPVTRIDGAGDLFWARSPDLALELIGAGFTVEHTERWSPGPPAGDLVVSWCRKPEY